MPPKIDLEKPPVNLNYFGGFLAWKKRHPTGCLFLQKYYYINPTR